MGGRDIKGFYRRSECFGASQLMVLLAVLFRGFFRQGALFWGTWLQEVINASKRVRKKHR